MSKNNSNLYIIPLVGLAILFLAFCIIAFFYHDFFSYWKLIVISFLLVAVMQILIATLVKHSYKKILKNNSVTFTIIALYIFMATAFYFLILLVMLYLKYFA